MREHNPAVEGHIQPQIVQMAQSGRVPLAKMPAVKGPDIKHRAAKLRALGSQKVAAHLKAQYGKTHSILMENPSMGRTEQFTEVVFSTPQAEGCLISAKIIGMRNQQLVA